MVETRARAGARRTTRERAIVALGVVVTCLCVLGACAFGIGYWKYAHITRYDVDLPPAAKGDPQNFLLVGSDSRANLDPNAADIGGFVNGETGGQRTDTIMILRVDPDEKTAQLLSLPRDLYVPIGGPDGRHDRINTAYSQGRQVLIDTIQSALGIPINHYVEIDFQGFKDLVSSIGGVTIYFDTPLRDRNTGLNITDTGCKSLGPIASLAFVRSRHLQVYDANRGRWVSDPTGDFGRISRQQVFIRHAIKKAISKGLTNPVKLNSLVNVGVKNVGLDPSLKVRDLLSFGQTFARFNEKTLKTYELKANPFYTSGGANVLELDERASEPVLNLFRGLPKGAVSPESVDLQVLNGGNINGQANDVAAALAKVGFNITESANSTEPFPRTAVYYAPGSENAALEVVSHLNIEPVLVADDSVDENEVVLVIGPDFTTVHEQPSRKNLRHLLPKKSARSGHASTTGSSTTTTTAPPDGYTPGTAPPEARCA